MPWSTPSTNADVQTSLKETEDCDGNVLDECGVCGGDGIAEGDCDCDGNQSTPSENVAGRVRLTPTATESVTTKKIALA